MADALVRGSIGAPVTLFRGVQVTEVQGIHADLFANLIHHRLASQRGLCRSWGTISVGLGTIHHNVEAFDLYVSELERCEYALTTGVNDGTWETACLESEVRLGSCDLAFIGGPHLDAHVCTWCGAGGFENVCSGHGHLDGTPGLSGQGGRQRL